MPVAGVHQSLLQEEQSERTCHFGVPQMAVGHLLWMWCDIHELRCYDPTQEDMQQRGSTVVHPTTSTS